MNLNQSMPLSTLRLFNKISLHGGLKSLVLVGGTALAIRERHRLSEDLDFCSIDGNGLELNRNEIDRLLDRLEESGSQITPIINLEEQQKFEINGDDLLDHHQRYVIDGVKVDFFVIQSRKLRGFFCQHKHEELIPGIKVADTETLFHLKSNVVLDRLKSRDFFDIKTLLEHDNYEYETIIESIQSYSALRLSEDAIIQKLTPESFSDKDEGFEGLVDNHECVFSELILFFQKEALEYKKHQAEKMFKEDGSSPGFC